MSELFKLILDVSDIQKPISSGLADLPHGCKRAAQRQKIRETVQGAERNSHLRCYLQKVVPESGDHRFQHFVGCLAQTY